MYARNTGDTGGPLARNYAGMAAEGPGEGCVAESGRFSAAAGERKAEPLWLGPGPRRSAPRCQPGTLQRRVGL